MLEMQKKLISYLKELNKKITTLDLPKEIYTNFKFDESIKTLEEQELLVPVIGAFSAGKSSLLNSFLGKNYLSTKITPETALATELRFNHIEYIEAIKTDGHSIRFEIGDIEKIKAIAKEFKHLVYHINSPALEKIAPLVLVDMPGFESPLESHNKAIMEYITKGVHYIVLTSIEDGNITKSMKRQLQDIQEYNRDFSFFISKTNLRSPVEVSQIAQKIQEQIKDFFDITKTISMVDDNGKESLNNVLKEIDPNNLFENLFITSLKDKFYNIKQIINSSISTLSKNKDQNSKNIEELKKAVLNIEKERDILISETKAKHSNKSIENIIDAVGIDLSANVREITNTIMRNGEQAASIEISEIVRNSLIRKVKFSITEISNSIIDNFSLKLTDIDKTMSDVTMDKDWLNVAKSNVLKDLLEKGKGLLDSVVKERNPDGSKLYKLVTTILSVTTDTITPILEMVIIFLPDLLNFAFGQSKEEKELEQRSKIESSLLSETIPSIKRDIRSKLPEIFNKQIEEIISDISNKFSAMIEEKWKAIELTQKEIDEKNINIEEQITKEKNVISDITQLTNNTLF